MRPDNINGNKIKSFDYGFNSISDAQTGAYVHVHSRSRTICEAVYVQGPSQLDKILLLKAATRRQEIHFRNHATKFTVEHFKRKATNGMPRPFSMIYGQRTLLTNVLATVHLMKAKEYL